MSECDPLLYLVRLCRVPSGGVLEDSTVLLS
jgi:hypothetical protein